MKARQANESDEDGHSKLGEHVDEWLTVEVVVYKRPGFDYLGFYRWRDHRIIIKMAPTCPRSDVKHHLVT